MFDILENLTKKMGCGRIMLLVQQETQNSKNTSWQLEVFLFIIDTSRNICYIATTSDIVFDMLCSESVGEVVP